MTPPQTITFGPKATDWSTNLVFNKFDPSLGTLNGVQITVTDHLVGSAAFENLSGSSAKIIMGLVATVSVGRPNNDAPITTSAVLAKTSDQAAAFDGKLDFAGTSGKTYANLVANGSAGSTSTSHADLVPFIGGGTIELPASAMAVSSASGSGNLATQFTTFATVTVTVQYSYIPVGASSVPEPSSVALLGVGGVFALVARRRRRRARTT